MTLFKPTLWPDSQRVPVRRLLIALLATPLAVSLLMALFVFLIAGMTESRQQDVLAVTIESTLSLSALVYLFTATFGVAGFALLWAFGLAGPLIWAGLGGLLGAVAGLLFSLVVEGLPVRVSLVAGAVVGWVIFVLLRWFAGVRNAR